MDDEIAFADAEAYLFYVDNIYFFRSQDWYVFEPLSKGMLIMLRWLTGDTINTVSWAHYYISLFYLLGTLIIFPPASGNWRGLIMAFALYGPQLAFVTIRATPAYIVESIAVLYAFRGQYRAFLFLGLAILFHISSVVMIAPIGALFLLPRLKILNRLQDPKTLGLSLVVSSSIFVFFGSAIFSFTRTIFENIPFLGKYIVFLVGLDDGGSSKITTFAIGHFVLLIGITAFVCGFLVVRDAITRNVAIFVIVSYVIYFFMFAAFSPIAAFRQTPFWMLPAFSIFPWERIGWRGAGQFLFAALALGMFLFQFSRVIQL